MSNKKTIYFPNLNGLRFVAAVMILFPHIEQLKGLLGLPVNQTLNNFHIAKQGLILFFVLSGFLVTYLLMQEKKENGIISVRHFYTRRILRTWPLYYFISMLGLFILPWFGFFYVPSWTDALKDHYLLQIFCFLFFLPNLSSAAFVQFPYVAHAWAPVPFVGQAWVIGVENQFYFMWPLLLNKARSIVTMLIGVIGVYFTIFFTMRYYWVHYQQFIVHKYVAIIIMNFIDGFRIDCMALGGLAAYLLFYNKHKVLKLLYNTFSQIALYVIVLLMLASGFKIKFLTDAIYAVFFALIILNLAGNSKSIINLEHKAIAYLGKISYGIYMYQFLATFIILKLAIYFRFANTIIINNHG